MTDDEENWIQDIIARLFAFTGFVTLNYSQSFWIDVLELISGMFFLSCE